MAAASSLKRLYGSGLLSETFGTKRSLLRCQGRRAPCLRHSAPVSHNQEQQHAIWPPVLRSISTSSLDVSGLDWRDRRCPSCGGGLGCAASGRSSPFGMSRSFVPLPCPAQKGPAFQRCVVDMHVYASARRFLSGLRGTYACMRLCTHEPFCIQYYSHRRCRLSRLAAHLKYLLENGQGVTQRSPYSVLLLENNAM